MRHGGRKGAQSGVVWKAGSIGILGVTSWLLLRGILMLVQGTACARYNLQSRYGPFVKSSHVPICVLWQVYRDLLSSITSVEDADKKMAELASQGKIDPAFLQITAKVGASIVRLHSAVLPVKSGT